MKRKCFLTGLAAFACVNALSAATGDVLATTQAPAQFEVYTSGNATYAVSLLSEIEELLPVFCESGDKVAATAYDGSVKTLCDGAHTGDDPVRFVPDKGGMWTLTNSNGEVAQIGVGWSVLGDIGHELTAGAAFGKYAVETVKSGPDRMVKKPEAPPVAYSADNWINYSPGAVGLSIAAPDGRMSEFNLAGSGAIPFTFDKNGEWTIVMTMADGSNLSSKVRIVGGMAMMMR